MSSPIKPPLDLSLLFKIHHPGITAFYFRFRNAHAYGWTKARALDEPLHPLKQHLLKRYAVREEVPLWWSCVTTREVGHTDRVVRSWLARRTRNAFKESLRKKGYDTNGRPLLESGNEANIFGTANLSVKREAMKLSFVELVKQTDVAVTKMQEWKGGGEPDKSLPALNGRHRRQFTSTKPISRALIENQ
jgi:hypothetical protein